MNPTQSAERAIEMLEQQVADLSGIRNATARDPSFKNWRQATLTAMQRIWPGDQARSERFRRIPFSPADPRADHRAIREQYSRGCQEAGRVLKSYIEEIREKGVPEFSDESLPRVPEGEFEDGFPTLELPAGESAAPADPARLAENLLADLGDEPPQGKAPDSPDPPRLTVVPPPAAAAAPPPAVVSAPPAAAAGPPVVVAAAPEPPALVPTPAPPVAPAVAAAPAAPAPAAPAPAAPAPASPTAANSAKKGPGMKARLRDLLGFAHLSAKSLAGSPRENSPIPAEGTVPPPAATPAGSLGMMPLGDEVGSAAPPVQQPVLQRPVLSSASADPGAEATSDVPADWPVLPRRAPDESAPAAGPAPWPAATPETNTPSAAAADAPAEPVVGAPAESNSVIMSKPTTLRGNIEKVSIESLISPEFRAPEAEAEPAPAPPATAAAPPAPEAPPAAPAPPVAVGKRPPLALVPPLLDDPEFNVDPTPSAELPTPSAEVQVPGQPAKPARGAAKAPRAATPAPPPRQEPAAAEVVPQDEVSPEDGQAADVDADQFARAAEDFMKSSPVLGASPKRTPRSQETPDFEDPDAIAVASMAGDLARMEVPKERHAELRARLMDLARRLERGELEWSALRKAVWFAMEHPELARRLMPVLLPWIDRAA